MTYYILFYQTISNFLELRKPHRNLHLKHVQNSFDLGHLILGGAFVNPSDGAALIFRVPNEEMVKNFVRDDPYIKNGLVSHWRIQQWNVVIGQDAN